ncbi:DMT family transporter [Conexibacter sp. SYSU D00693]|uniref:DMT family transporter n=1 Tax=Conexibacter sp. SYSU D00693 TaxID=2812560 RepID=UPI00196B1029|nr:DMT family transporter [Conexibacter sp. SYSU D00693]
MTVTGLWHDAAAVRRAGPGLAHTRRRRRGRRSSSGLLLGAAGIAAFSFSLPATRVAVRDLDPWLVSFGRAAVAALLAAVVLLAVRAPRPTAAQVRSLLVVALGVAVAFPLGTALAMQDADAAHGAVVIAVLPAATAVMAVLRAGERPSGWFWAASGAGVAVTVVFALSRSGGGGLAVADVQLMAGTLLCALGYAEGAVLARELGGARTICWALVLAAPLTLTVSAASLVTAPPAGAAATAWLGLAYVSVFSMFLGFFAWYAGLARGGVAKVGQVQLAQPLLTLGWSALVLGEHVGPEALLTALAVVACVVVTQRARVAAPTRAQQAPAAG